MRTLVAVAFLSAGCIVHVTDPNPGPSDSYEEAVMTSPGEVVMCSGDDELVIEEKSIETDGAAVTVQGNCDVTILRSRLVGGVYGLLVQGNGDVQIDGSYVEGAVGAAAVQGNGTLTSRNTQYVGPVQRGGNGDVVDEGGNTWTLLP